MAKVSQITVFVTLTILTILCLNSAKAVDLMERKQLVSEVQSCARDIHNILETSESSENEVISITGLLQTFENLKKLSQKELDFVNGVLNKLEGTDLDNVGEYIINATEEIDKALPSGDFTATVEEPKSCKQPKGNSRQTDHSEKPSGQNGGGTWRGGKRKSTGDLGAHRIKFFEGCNTGTSCTVSGMTLLPDGTVVIADSENYQLQVYGLDGTFIRSHSTVPLAPLRISRLKDYKILAKVPTLDGGYGILEMDMWDGSSRLLIELGRYNWEFSCRSPIGMIEDTIFVGCSPYLFLYHTNGTLLQRVEAKGSNSWIQIFETETGSDRTVIGGPVFTTSRYGPVSINTVVNEQLDQICTFNRSSLRGAVGKDGSVYAIDYHTRSKVIKINRSCQEEGVIITTPWDIENIAVFNNILVATGHRSNRRKFSGDRVLVFELP